MKILLKILIALLPFYTINTFAAVSSFEVQSNPEKVKVWEAVDITIKAVDDSWKVDTSYVWGILIISYSDSKAEFPWITNNSYTFKKEDAWIIKFENWVKFTIKWNQDITVYDFNNDEIVWVAKVEVTDWETQLTGEISITTPESGVTLPTKEVEVSWQTNKNSKINIMLNDKKVWDTLSNSWWIFTYNLKDLSWEIQKIKAILLDSDNKEIATSQEVSFKIQSSWPEFKSIELNPNTLVEWLTVVNVKVLATAWLSEVQIVINDTLENLKESSPWEYSWSFTAPKDDWEYSIDVNWKNSLGLSFIKKDAIKVTVKNIELLTSVNEVTVEEVKVNCDDFKKELIIKNVKVVKMKSKSILSWDKVEKATSYNVYKLDSDWKEILFQNILENKIEIEISWDKIVHEDFVIKAVFKDDVCNVEWEVSQATKIQTWPTEIIVIFLAVLFAGIIYFYKRRKNV